MTFLPLNLLILEGTWQKQEKVKTTHIGKLLVTPSNAVTVQSGWCEMSKLQDV